MPRLSPAVLAALLVAAPALAGCVDFLGGKPAAEVDAGLSPASNESDENVTETPDGRGEIAAFKETNATEKGAGGRAHDHDYWNGQDRAIIYEEDFGLVPLPLTPRGAPPGTAIADFNIPAPKLVYEGTSSLELLFSHQSAAPGGRVDPGPPSVLPVPVDPPGADVPYVPHPAVNVHVWYITAADDPGEWRDAGVARAGTPLVIPVKPLETDMPHSVASLWLFRVFTDEPNEFWTNLTITAVKGSEVAKWPPHPDLYANGPERVIYDGPAETKVNSAADFVLYGEDSNWFYPEKVISWGTEKLKIDVTIEAFEPQVPVEAAYFYLDYHNASFAPKIGNGGTSGGSAVDEGSDGTNYAFEIPVDAYGFDSPYGTASRWAFRMLAAFDEQGLEDLNDSIFCVNCTPYTLRYHLKITAVGQSTSGEMSAMEMNNDGQVEEEPEGEA